MAYIGYNPSQLAVAPFAVKSFTGDGSTTTFTLDQSVPGANEANVEVVVENVQQNPIDAYTIGGNLNNSLIFSEAPASGAAIYVIHKGEATYNLQPSTGSVTAATLDPVLRNFTVDNFTGNGSTTTYTLTDTPYSANSILVTVDGIVQTATTNYTVSGTTLSFGASAPDSGAVITVVHMGFSSGNKAVMDGSITTVKLNSAGIAPTITGGTITGGIINGATFAAGAVGTPSITTTGDLNTGIFFPAADTIAFAEGGAEAMRIDSTGNVGIGATTPSGKLDVVRSSISTATFDEALIRVINTGTATLNQRVDIGMRFQDGTYNGIGGISMIRESATARSGTLQFAPIASDGNPTNAMRLDSAGLLTLPFGQIKFPAVQNASSDANTLDDYEEGSWTPVFTAASVNPTGVAYTTQVGRYTKIGKSVTVWANLGLSSKGTGGSGEVRITGLPFASEGTGGLYPRGAGDIGSATWGASKTQITFATVPSSSYVAIIESGSGQSLLNPTWANTNNNTDYAFSITYPTA